MVAKGLKQAKLFNIRKFNNNLIRIYKEEISKKNANSFEESLIS